MAEALQKIFAVARFFDQPARRLDGLAGDARFRCGNRRALRAPSNPPNFLLVAVLGRAMTNYNLLKMGTDVGQALEM
ncbi:MAG: hypothetical protein ONA90_00700 [candidate division KSB1 bacterium]|nr:hypothetical protein [candidate division KSB1 bacterium]